MVVYCLKHGEQVVYVGSSKYFPARLNQYKQDFKNKTKQCKLLKTWRALGWDEFEFVMLDDLDNTLEDDARLILEGDYIQKFDPPLNTFKRPKRTMPPSYYVEEWAKRNPEKRKENKSASFARWYAENGEARNQAKREARAKAGGPTEEQKRKQAIRYKRYQENKKYRDWLKDFVNL